MKRILALLGTLAIAATLAACGDDDGETADESATTAAATEDTAAVDAAAVDVADPWARAMAPTATTSAVYMTLTAAEDDRLVAASVDVTIADTVELHEVVPADGGDMGGGDMDGGDMDGGDMGGMGEMVMQEVEFIELPAGEAVELKPGGLHVMLLGMRRQLEAGETIDVTLTFEKAGETTVTAEVREV